MSLAPAPAQATQQQPPPYLDLRTRPLSPLGQLATLLLLPLAALRLALLFAGLGAYTLILLLLNARTEDPDAPNFRAYGLVMRLSFAVPRWALACCGFRVRVHGAEHVRAAYASRTATVVVANHVSYLDVFAVAAAVGPYFPVSRADAASWPVFGALLRMWGFTGVDRSRSGGEGVTSLITARARRTGAWAQHPPVLCFPEGTCTTGDALLRFKSGAFVAGVPVLPVALRYTAGNLTVGWVWREHGAAAPPLSRLPGELVHLARLLLARRKTLDVFVLPPHTPDAAQRADPACFAEAVRRQMGDVLRVPLDHRGVDEARAFFAERIAGYAQSA